MTGDRLGHRASDTAAANIREARKRRGWNVAELADRCPGFLTENVIENIESGRRRDGERTRDITVDELLAIAEALGVRPAALLPDLANGTPAVPLSEIDAVIEQLQGMKDIAQLAREHHEPEGRAERWQRAAEQPTIVAAIVTSDRGVLITQRRDGKPPWGFVTGEHEIKDDRLEVTAGRELKEEVGLEDVQIEAEIGRRVHPATGRLIVYFAAAPTPGTEAHVVDQDELADVKWASLAEALELMPDMFQPVRDYLAEQLG